MSDSVAFDRAAEYYDRTRGNSPEGLRKTIDLLTVELRERGTVLEVGVGTGQLGLPLHEAGIAVVGLDLARPMMDKLVEKAGGRSPFPLVQGDATRMPFRDGGVRRGLPPVGPPPDPRVAERARRDRPRRPAGRRVPGIARELWRSSVGDPGAVRRADRRLYRAAGAHVGRLRRAGRGGDRARPGAPCAPPIPEIGREGLDAFIDAIADEPVLVDLEDRGLRASSPDGRRGPPLGRGALRSARRRFRSTST